MSLCNKLEAGLLRSQADSKKLMKAVVGRMLAGGINLGTQISRITRMHTDRQNMVDGYRFQITNLRLSAVLFLKPPYLHTNFSSKLPALL